MTDSRFSEDSENALERRLANLKPFQPGQSGNPAGKPPGTVSLRTELRKQLSGMPEGQRRTFAELLVTSALADAIMGDARARKLVFEYIEGRPEQPISMHDLPPLILDGNESDFEEREAVAQAQGQQVIDLGLGRGPDEHLRRMAAVKAQNRHSGESDR